MRPVTEKVIQRLVYEKLLLANTIPPHRRKITLEEFLDAAQEESRIYSALAAILIYKPKIFHGLAMDIKKHPEISSFMKNLFLETQEKKKLFGNDKAFYQKSARTFKDFLEAQRSQKKSRTLLLRLSDADFHRLKKLTELMNSKSVSETIRFLAKEKEKQIHQP